MKIDDFQAYHVPSHRSNHSQVYSCTQSLKIETVYKCLRLLQKGQNYYHWYSHHEYNISSLPSASHRLLLLRNLPESFLKIHVTTNIRIRVTAFLKIYNICDYFLKCKSMLACVYLQQTMLIDICTYSVFRMNLNSGLPLKATFSIVYSLDTNYLSFTYLKGQVYISYHFGTGLHTRQSLLGFQFCFLTTPANSLIQ